MNKSTRSKRSASTGASRKFTAAIEALESRAYLNGVVFSTPQTTNATGSGIAYTDLVDLNGDGKADLVTANSSGATSGSINIFYGNPSNDNETFTAGQTFAVGFSPLTIVDGAFGVGGKMIAVGSQSNNHVQVLTETTATNSSTFTALTPLTATGLTNTQSVTLGDFFGNGLQDIAVASYDSGTSNNVAIFRNNGNGTFASTPTQVLSVPHSHVASITSFTLANGTVDLAVADADDNAVTVLTNTGGTFSIAPNADHAVGGEPVTIKSGKFDQGVGSQNDDLVTANLSGGSVSVLPGNGLGGFGTANTTQVPGGGVLKVRVATVNNDSYPDLIGLLNGGSTAPGVVLLGNGDGSFHVGTTIPSSNNATAIAAGDLDGDGLTDMVLANTSSVSAAFNITNQDHTPPTATVSAASNSAIGAQFIEFVVNYSDNTQVDASTINASNITVTDPSGNARPVTLVSNPLTLANGATVSATYEVPATGNSLTPGDNGAYTVTATSNTANAVKDANGNPLAGGTIGTFSVNVSTTGPNLVAGAVTARFPATGVVSGTTRTTGVSVRVLNTGTATAKGSMVINLYANTDASTTNGGTLVATITRPVNLRAGKQTVYAIPAFTWPQGLAGSYFLVAQVNATNTIAETNSSDNVSASATAASVAAPFIELQNLWNQRTPAAFKLGRRVVLSVLEMNNGNVPARGTATATVLASPTGSLSDATQLASVPVRINVAAGHKQTVPVGFTMPANTIASGTYHLIVTISFPGDVDSTNDTVIQSGTFTV